MSLLSESDRRLLEARWREPHRHYHSWQHLEECLALFATLRAEAERPDEVEAALWFHDAVYDSHAVDNEEQSAALAAAMLAERGVHPSAIERIERMVLATRHAAPPSPGDEALVCDIDLAILGASEARFDEYERQVREEYAWVPELLYRARRAEILSRLLARRRLFATPLVAERLEAAARANLTRAIARLGAL